MKSMLLVYKTNTGFTKKYVDWIVEKIPCKTIPLDQMNTINISDYDIIIYGAGMHAGRIQGLKEFRKKALNLVSKEIIIFVTGGAPNAEEIVSNIKTNNFSQKELESIKLFYFQSGINYEKMGLSDKAIMKIYSTLLGLKTNKSSIEDGTSKAILRSFDHSSSEYIKPMIDYLNQLSKISLSEEI